MYPVTIASIAEDNPRTMDGYFRAISDATRQLNINYLDAAENLLPYFRNKRILNELPSVGSIYPSMSNVRYSLPQVEDLSFSRTKISPLSNLSRNVPSVSTLSYSRNVPSVSTLPYSRNVPSVSTLSYSRNVPSVSTLPYSRNVPSVKLPSNNLPQVSNYSLPPIKLPTSENRLPTIGCHELPMIGY